MAIEVLTVFKLLHVNYTLHLKTPCNTCNLGIITSDLTFSTSSRPKIPRFVCTSSCGKAFDDNFVNFNYSSKDLIMLTERIHEQPLSESDDDQSLDFFESSITTIFNDVRNQHGEPGRLVTYASPLYGSIKLGLADVNKNDTKLFSHNLWNAGVEVAEMIEDGRLEKLGLMGGVKGKDVIEVGAGGWLKINSIPMK